MSLFDELKPRNVIRVACLHRFAASRVETVLPIVEMPNRVLRAVVVAPAIGFVPAMVVARVLELIAGDMLRVNEVSEGASITSGTANWMNRALVALPLLAAAHVASDRLVRAPRLASLAETGAKGAPAMPAATTPMPTPPPPPPPGWMMASASSNRPKPVMTSTDNLASATCLSFLYSSASREPHSPYRRPRTMPLSLQ